MERNEMQTSEHNRKEETSGDKCQKFTTTLVIYYCNFTLGIMVYFLGPTLLDFRDSLQTETEIISLVFTVTQISFLISVILFGVVFNYVNRHILVILLLFIMGSTVLALPHCTSLTAFFVLAGLMAASGGGWVTAQAAWVIEIWKSASDPFIHGQHFLYAVGTMCPPLIFGPYLSSDNFKSHELSNTTFNSTTIQAPAELPIITNASFPPKNSLIIPCTITGSIILLGAIFQLALLIFFKIIACAPPSANSTLRNTSNHAELTESDWSLQQQSTPTEKPQASKYRNIALIFFSACLVGAWQSIEACAGQFLAPFTHFAEVNLSEADGAQIFFYYSVAFTVGRGIGVFAILKVPPHFILFANFFLAILGNSWLLIYGHSQLEHLWIGSVLLGLGYSCALPSVFAYVKSHIQITNFVGAFLMAVGGALAAVYPIPVGKYIDQLPTVLMYVNFGGITLAAIAFTIILSLTKTKSS